MERGKERKGKRGAKETKKELVDSECRRAAASGEVSLWALGETSTRTGEGS